MVSPETTLSSRSHWIVVADEFQAIFYAREDKHSPLQKLSTFENETAREKLADLISDRGGRSFGSQGAGRHAYDEEKSNLKTQSYAAFAKNVAERIREGSLGRKFRKLIIIAPPRFLGVLRKALDKAGVEPDLTINKEVTGQDAAFIQKLLEKTK